MLTGTPRSRQRACSSSTSLAAQTRVIVTEPDHQAERVYRSVGFVASEGQPNFERPPAG